MEENNKNNLHVTDSTCGQHRGSVTTMRSLLLDPCLVSRFHKACGHNRADTKTNNNNQANTNNNNTPLPWRLVFVQESVEKDDNGDNNGKGKDRNGSVASGRSAPTDALYPSESYLEIRVQQNTRFCTSCLEQGMAVLPTTPEVAQAHFRQGLEVDPQHADLWVALALSQTRTLGEALSSLDKALQYQPQHPQALQYRQEMTQQLQQQQQKQQALSRRQRKPAPLQALQDVQMERALQEPLALPLANVANEEERDSDSSSSDERRRERRRRRRRRREKERERRRRKRRKRESDKKKKHRKRRRQQRRHEEDASSGDDDSEVKSSSDTADSSTEEEEDSSSREYRNRKKKRQWKKQRRQHSPLKGNDDDGDDGEAHKPIENRESDNNDKHEKDTKEDVSSLSSVSRSRQSTRKRHRHRRTRDSDSGATVDSLELMSKRKRRNLDRKEPPPKTEGGSHQPKNPAE